MVRIDTGHSDGTAELSAFIRKMRALWDCVHAEAGNVRDISDRHPDGDAEDRFASYDEYDAALNEALEAFHATVTAGLDV